MFQVISSSATILLAAAGATPRHEHDCDCCRFMGTYDGAECGRKFDLYLCPSEGCLIARWGVDGEYSCSQVSIVRRFISEYGDSELGAALAAYDALPVARAIGALNKGSALKEFI